MFTYIYIYIYIYLCVFVFACVCIQINKDTQTTDSQSAGDSTPWIDRPVSKDIELFVNNIPDNNKRSFSTALHMGFYREIDMLKTANGRFLLERALLCHTKLNMKHLAFLQSISMSKECHMWQCIWQLAQGMKNTIVESLQKETQM